MNQMQPNTTTSKTSKLPLKEDRRKYNGGHKNVGVKPKFGKGTKIKRVMFNIPEYAETEVRLLVKECLKKYEVSQ